MSYKKIIICICAVIAVAAALLIILLSNKEEAFRSILVYEVEGSAVIEREGVGSMNAAENLYLESGDRVSVALDSSMRMKLDDDKYVMAEADTVFSVEAQGSGENSKTKICLERGAVTNEIQHPLSEGSQYETSTPNSVMAVRGTIYRVELYTDENGDQNTKLCCFQGKVGATPILPDGTYGEEILVPAGSELIVYSDGTVDGPRDITYEELPEQARQNLKDMLENGQSMTGITLEALKELENQAAGVNGEAGESEEAGKSGEEQTALSDAAANSESTAGTDAEGSDASQSSQTGSGVKESAQAGKGTKSSVQDSKNREDSAQADKEAKDSTQAALLSQMTAEQNLQTPGNTNAQPKAPAFTENQNAGSDEADNSQNDNGGSSDQQQSDKKKPNKNKHDKDESGKEESGKDEPVTPPETETYTVTFKYGGAVFATQEVESGETVSEPLLMPSAAGAWDFDFGTGIEADTTIQWKNST